MPPFDHLIAEIRAFAPADEAEARDREAILALLALGPAVLTRSHFEPGHVTGSAFIVDTASRALLLHHHRRLGKWLQMGGHLETGELPAAAALREGMEESGLTDLEFVVAGVVDLDVHPIPAGKGEPPHRHFDFRYVVRTASPASATADAAESLGLGWFPLDEANARMNEPGATRMLAKIARILDRAIR